MKTQTEQESTHIIEIMKEEKKVMYQRIQQYERELADKEDQAKRILELEVSLEKLMNDIEEQNKKIQEKDEKINEV